MKLSLLLTLAFFSAQIFTADAQVKKTSSAKKTTAVKKKAVSAKPKTKPAEIKKDQTVRVKIVTDSGTMIVRLYDSTPLHRDNFVKLVKEGFYDSLMFHRVISQFMIQGGDPLSKNAPAGAPLGSGGSNMERIPAEFKRSLIHKKGVLAAARDGNPEKASSACQFYIVDGKIPTDAELDMLENRKNIKYTEEQRKIYKEVGGTPFLDMDYTVFGELESGFEVIGKIANVPKDPGNRPLGDIRMYMELIK